MDDTTLRECLQMEQEAINDMLTSVIEFVLVLDTRREELERLVEKIHTMVQRNA